MYFFCVCENPIDYPDKYVAYGWIVQPKPIRTAIFYIEDTLKELRKHKPSLMRVHDRRQDDDEAIIEYWF